MDAYTNKPTTVYAEQLDGTEAHASKLAQLINDTESSKDWTQKAEAIMEAVGGPFVRISAAFGDDGFLFLHPGDWLMFGTEGEYYPCKDSVFTTKYEAAK